MPGTYSRLRGGQFIFHCFYFPESRKDDVLPHGTDQTACKILPFQQIPLSVYGQLIIAYIVLVKFISVKIIIIVLSCLYVA